jgi:hypothetical protein
MQVIAVEAPPDQPITPLPPFEGIASWAVTIAARTHRQCCMIALRAIECRTTKPSGAATWDASHDAVELDFFGSRRFGCPPIPPQNLSNCRWGKQRFWQDGSDQWLASIFDRKQVDRNRID